MTKLLKKKIISIRVLIVIEISLLILALLGLTIIQNTNLDYGSNLNSSIGISDVDFVSINDDEDYYDWDYMNGEFFRFWLDIQDASAGDIDASDEVKFWIAPASDTDDTQVMENIQSGSYSHGSVSTWFGPDTYGGDTQIYYMGNGFWVFEIDSNIMDDYLGISLAFDCYAHDVDTGDQELLSWEDRFYWVRVIEYSVILTEPDPGQYETDIPFDIEWSHPQFYGNYFDSLDEFEVWLDSGTHYTTTNTYYTISSISDGLHTAHVIAKSLNHGYGIEQKVDFYIDTTPPTITVNTPNGNYYTSAPLMNVDFTDAINLDDAYYKIDSYSPTGTDTTGWIPIFTGHSGTSYTTDFAMDSSVWSGLSEGSHTAYFKAWDDPGNANDGSSPSWQFYKDTAGPSIMLNTPNGNYYSSAPLMDVDFSDASGLDDAFYKVDSYSPTGLDTTGWTPIFTSHSGTSYMTDFAIDGSIWSGLSDGSHTIYFKTWDDSGNINDGSSPSWQFYKDTNAPSIVVNMPDGNYYSSAPLIDVDFSDIGGLGDAYHKIDSYSPTGLDTTGWNPIFTSHSSTSFTTDFALDGTVWNGLSDGSYTVYFKAWDDSGNINDGASPSWQFYKDTEVPSIVVNTPNGNYYSSAPLMDVDFSDASGLDDAFYKVDSYSPTGLDTTGWTPIFTSHSGTSYTTDFAMDSAVWSGLSDGNYTVYFKAWDDSGNINDGASPSWQFYKDTGAPSILVNTPNGNYYTSAPLMDVDFSDVGGLDDAYYKVDSYTPTGTNTTGWLSIFTDSSGTNYMTDFAMDSSVWDGLGEGSHVVYFKAWDDLANVNDGSLPSWQFYKDMGAPTITVNTPNGNYYASAPLMDVDFSDIGGLDEAYYKVDSYSPTGLDTTGWILIFTSHSGTIFTTDFEMDSAVWIGLSEGSHTVYFKAWDDTIEINDGATPIWQFYKDTVAPSITVNTPDGNNYASAPLMDVDFLDNYGLDDAYYKVDSYSPSGLDTTGWIQVFSSYSGTSYATDFTIDSSVWDGLGEGSHVVYFKAWDDSGYINDGSSPSWQFYKDTNSPTITVNTPNGNYYASTPLMDVEFSDVGGLDDAYYKVDSYTPTGIDTTGWISIFTGSSGTTYTTDFAMSSSVWDGLGEGSHFVYFKAWDDSGNVNDGSLPSWQFYKDTGAPTITVNTPNGNYYASVPLMDVDFFDASGLNYGYYKVDSYNPTGLDTTGWIPIFTDISSTTYTTDFAMDGSVWSGLSDGSHTVYFKAWDDTIQIKDGAIPIWQFYKDTSAPVITINSPDGSYFDSSPLMDVDFSDVGGLDDAYYKVDFYTPTGLDTTGWIPIFSSYSGTSYTTDFTIDSSVWDGLGEGSHIVYIKVWDDLSNLNDGSLPSWLFYKVNDPLNITVNIADGNYYLSAPLMDVDFSDALDLDNAYYKVDSYSPTGFDTTGWIPIFTDLSGTIYTSNFVMDSSVWSGLSDGSHTVYFKAWDDEGIVKDGSSLSWQFYKDTTIPSILLLSPNDYSVRTSGTQIILDISDSIGLFEVLYNWNNAASNSTYSELTPPTIPTGDGVHALYIFAYDNAGNLGNRTFIFICDDTDPSAEISGITDGKLLEETITITVTASDENGISYILFYINGIQVANQSSNNEFTLDTTGYIDGEYVLKFEVYDPAGNYFEQQFLVEIKNKDAPPNVPGFHLGFILITTIIFIGIFILKKYREY